MLRDKLKFSLPTTNSDSLSGINNSSTVEFEDSRLESLVKEELQNSTDAHDPTTNEPTIVTFERFDMDADDIPDRENIARHINGMTEFWENLQKQNTKVIEFLNKCQKLLEKDEKIPVLKVNDSNTVGLQGIDEDGSPWANLVKNDGVSDKPSDAGGAYGNGKNAAIACSDLHMVIYRTKNKDGEYGIQGAVKLPSYKKDGKHYLGNGFLSADVPEDGVSLLSTPALRENRELCSRDRKRLVTGTDKYIIGFNVKDDVQLLCDKVAVSAINSFYYAIYQGDLLVELFNGESLSHCSLEKLSKQYTRSEDSEKQDVYLDRDTLEQLETIRSPEAEHHFMTVFEDDDVEIIFRCEDGLHKRAAVIGLNGMKICDLNNFRGVPDFSAVVVFKKSKVASFFKQFEDVKHSGFQFDRCPEHKTEGDQALKTIHKQITKIAKEKEQQEGYDVTVFAGMSDVFKPNKAIVVKSLQDAATRDQVLPGKATSTETRKIVPGASKDDSERRSFRKKTGKGNGEEPAFKNDPVSGKKRNSISENMYGIRTSHRKGVGKVTYLLTIQTGADLNDAAIELKVASETGRIASASLNIKTVTDEYGKSLEYHDDADGKSGLINLGNLKAEEQKNVEIVFSNPHLRSLEVKLYADQQ